jgi:LAO/AO transport system kinase
MASRGALGGLARATSAVTQVFDAAGFDVILIETLGVGQSEIDIARLAHTVLVVESPGMGDEVQTAKAGILEIADILVVNKADLPGADKTSLALRSMLEIAYPATFNGIHHFSAGQDIARIEIGDGWIPPVLKTISASGAGVGDLVESICLHRKYLDLSGNIKLREQSRLKTELDDLVKAELMKTWHNSQPQGRYDEIFQRLLRREISPNQAVGFLTRETYPD